MDEKEIFNVNCGFIFVLLLLLCMDFMIVMWRGFIVLGCIVGLKLFLFFGIEKFMLLFVIFIRKCVNDFGIFKFCI